MPLPYEIERSAVMPAILAACRLTREVQDSIFPESGVPDPDAAIEKSDRSPVTVADLATQALIARTLETHFPDVPLVSEESSEILRGEAAVASRRRVLELVDRFAEPAGVSRPRPLESALEWIDRAAPTEPDAARSERFWTLDPIDGTKGFLRGEQYAIALALVEHGRVVLGILACPRLSFDREAPLGTDGRSATPHSGDGEILVAARGHGTYRTTMDGRLDDAPLFVSRLDDVAHTRVCESVERAHSAHGRTTKIMRELGIIAPTTRLDSQAKYAAVAGGLADLYLRIPTDPARRDLIWDHAAGSIVVEEAGGVVTDLDGKPLDFGHGRHLDANRGFVVSRPGVHPLVIEAAKRVLTS